MFKFPNKSTPVLYQGITSSSAAIHIEKAILYGTNIVAGVSKDKSVTMFQNIPVFQTVKEAVRKTKPQMSVIFSSPQRVLQDFEEAAKAHIPVIVCPVNHVPYQDVLKMKQLAQKYKVQLVGPSAPGIVTVGECLAGTVPAHLFPKGSVGIVSRSSSLTYEAVQQLSKVNLGVSSCAAIGSAAIIGSSLVPFVEAFLKDTKTNVILLIGKASGEFEYELIDYLKKKKNHKKIAVYIPGQHIVREEKTPVIGVKVEENALQLKEKALEKVGITVIHSATEIGSQVLKMLLAENEEKYESK
ncbi:MAG: hypothetical protein IJY92_05070 [Alphaproteobacteria bacterium]|nr:hypothetical protein [Alphaproteobacteria bacterium]